MISSLTAGTFLILIGLLIWKFKLVHLIPGVRTNSQTDKEGLAKWLGSNIIIMGIVIWLVGAIQILIFKETRFIVDLAIILGLSTRMAIGMGKYSKLTVKPSKKAQNKVSNKKR